MWFDANAALDELNGGRATVSDPKAVLCMHERPTDRDAESHVAPVARVARFPAPESEPSPNGMTPGGRAKTWTGRVVSLEDWRNLSEWERNGSRGRLWNGISKKWET